MSERSSGQLVPEVRLDKNGVPVRRWVRPATPAPAVAMAPPPRTAGTSEATLLGSVTDRLMADGRPEGWNCEGGWSPALGQAFRDKVGRLEPDTVVLLADLFSRDESKEVGACVCRMVEEAVPEWFIREYAAFASPLGEHGDDFESMEAAVKGLNQYGPHVLPASADRSREDETTRAACRALVHVALRLGQSGAKGTSSLASMVKGHDEGWVGYAGWYGDTDGARPMPVLQDHELIDLVIEHPEKAADFVEVIEANGFESVAILRESVLGTGATSLATGAL